MKSARNTHTADLLDEIAGALIGSDAEQWWAHRGHSYAQIRAMGLVGMGALAEEQNEITVVQMAAVLAGAIQVGYALAENDAAQHQQENGRRV